MTNSSQVTQPQLWLLVSIVGLTFLVLSLGYLLISTNRGRNSQTGSGPSRVLVVSGCKEPAPGMTRIGAQSGDRYMLQFDIPKSQASIREGATDAPPLLHAFGIRPNDSESRLGITYGPQRNDPVFDRLRQSSSRAVKGIIVNDKERLVGEDERGYLATGKRWRRSRFQGWVEAVYNPVDEDEATLFDKIIDSACLPPIP